METKVMSLLATVLTVFIVQINCEDLHKIQTDTSGISNFIGLPDGEEGELVRSPIVDESALGIDDVDKRNSLFRFGKRGNLFRFGKRGNLFRFGKRGNLFRFGRGGNKDDPENEGLKRTIFRFGKRDGLEDLYDYEDPSVQQVAPTAGDKRGSFFRYGRSRTFFRYGRSTDKNAEKRPHTPFRFGREEE
uniref:FMRFamide-related peptide 2 n=2 Tax=Sepiidae TaxID=6608 RepID=D8WXV2_SEPOF|nr:FMRFamide-related peptide 2 [Sepia officinalis]AKE48167.1 LFRFamide [Sepiella japonica]